MACRSTSPETVRACALAQLTTSQQRNQTDVISVMAVDKNDVRASFSNYGRPGLVAAPGVNVISAYPTLMWAVGSGTSYATPWVAGTAALVREHHRSATPAQVKDVIQRSADDVSKANGGTRTVRVNAERALATPLR
jgi:thermitase